MGGKESVSHCRIPGKRFLCWQVNVFYNPSNSGFLLDSNIQRPLTRAHSLDSDTFTFGRNSLETLRVLRHTCTPLAYPTSLFAHRVKWLGSTRHANCVSSTLLGPSKITRKKYWWKRGGWNFILDIKRGKKRDKTSIRETRVCWPISERSTWYAIKNNSNRPKETEKYFSVIVKSLW